MSRVIAKLLPTHKISALRDVRSGHCYVVADGMSTRWLEPEHLKNEDVIYVGASPSLNGLTFDARTVWVFPEPEVLLSKSFAVVVGLIFRRSLKPPTPFPSWASFRFFRSAYLEVIKQLDQSHVVVHLTNYFSVNSPQKWTVFRKLPEETGCSEINEPFRGSLNSAITMALLLGYREVRLIGFDYLLEPPQSGHWYESGEPISSPELADVYHHFLEQFLGQLSIKHILMKGQKSQIESLEYENVLGVQRSEPNTMKSGVKSYFSKCHLYKMA